ncbi:MAG: hypothetical protein HXS46_10775 [Theionarchaea archaeon]|nr:hypothetical protein [Theionarchaea archaeon]
MHEIGMLYEVGKLRMQAFVEDAERRRMFRPHYAKSCGFSMKKMRLSLFPDTKSC